MSTTKSYIIVRENKGVITICQSPMITPHWIGPQLMTQSEANAGLEALTNLYPREQYKIMKVSNPPVKKVKE